jgi:hypothetical protein
MELPLFEYSDPVDEAFAALSGPVLDVVGEPARLANAGDLLLFDVDIIDQGNAAGEYHLEITGEGAHWTSLLTTDHVRLEGGAVRATVQVDIPATATEDDRADVFLQAVHSADASRRGLVRLVVDVDESMDHPDDRLAAQQISGKVEDAPAPWLLPLLALAFLAARRRIP